MEISENISKRYFPVQKAIDFCAALIVLLLPFSSALPNLLLIPLLILVIINYKKFQWKMGGAMYIYGATILFLAILSFFKGSFLDDAGRYSKYFLVLLLFVLYTQVENKKYSEYALLVGTFIAMAISSVKVGTYMWDNPGYLLDVGKKVNELLLLERPYFGVLLFLSIFICLKNAEKSLRKYDYYILGLVFTAFSIFISARLAIGLGCLLFFIYLFKSRDIRRRGKIALTLILAFLFALSMGLSDNLMSRMHMNKEFEESLRQVKLGEPRFIIWPCASEIVQNDMNLLIGLDSYGEMENKLVDCYSEATKRDKVWQAYYIDRKFNTHNQFIDFLMIGGILPFVMLILMFVQPWLSKKIDFDLKVFFFLFFAFFVVENVLHRQLGCYLFGIFVTLYYNNKKAVSLKE